jgi:signal peptidase II
VTGPATGAEPGAGGPPGVAWARWLLLSFAVVVADQLTKLQVMDSLALYQRVPVLPFLDLVRLHNTGAAFSFLAGASGWQNRLFTGVAVVVSAGVLWWLVRLPARGKRWLALGLALLLGGAIGNLIDRLVNGPVTDFFNLLGLLNTPIFNVADLSITTGVIVLVLLMWRESREAKAHARPPETISPADPSA